MMAIRILAWKDLRNIMILFGMKIAVGVLNYLIIDSSSTEL